MKDALRISLRRLSTLPVGTSRSIPLEVHEHPPVRGSKPLANLTAEIFRVDADTVAITEPEFSSSAAQQRAKPSASTPPQMPEAERARQQAYTDTLLRATSHLIELIADGDQLPPFSDEIGHAIVGLAEPYFKPGDQRVKAALGYVDASGKDVEKAFEFAKSAGVDLRKEGTNGQWSAMLLEGDKGKIPACGTGPTPLGAVLSLAHLLGDFVHGHAKMIRTLREDLSLKDEKDGAPYVEVETKDASPPGDSSAPAV